MLKSIDDLSNLLDLQKSKVKKGILKVTIFGGPTIDADGISRSQRGIFLLQSNQLADAIVIPEDFKNWNHYGIYDDLLLFEEDVCALADSVLIFLESAGAIAEFGSLIKHPEIAPKLHVVIKNEYHQADSFITLGLLKHLKNKHDQSKIIVSQNDNLEIEECRHIVNSIKQQFEKNSIEESFKTTNIRHVLYLIVDFIELLQVAEIRDIKKFLVSLNLKSTVKNKRLEQLLLTLKNIGLIREQTILEYRCFFISDSIAPNIDYAFKPQLKIDPKEKKFPTKRLSWKAILFEESQEQEWRKLAFNMIKSSNMEGKDVA